MSDVPEVVSSEQVEIVTEPLDETMWADTVLVGTVQITDETGGSTAVMMRLLEGADGVDVAMTVEIARSTALALLRLTDSLTPLEPQKDGVFLRAPAGTNVVAALGEVFGEMFDLGPHDIAHLRARMAEVGLDVTRLSDDDVRAWHRALRSEERSNHG